MIEIDQNDVVEIGELRQILGVDALNVRLWALVGVQHEFSQNRDVDR